MQTTNPNQVTISWNQGSGCSLSTWPKWLIIGGDPNHLVTGMILQVTTYLSRHSAGYFEWEIVAFRVGLAPWILMISTGDVGFQRWYDDHGTIRHWNNLCCFFSGNLVFLYHWCPFWTEVIRSMVIRLLGGLWSTAINREADKVSQYLSGGFIFFYFHLYLGKMFNLTKIFQRGWNHQPVIVLNLYHSKSPLKPSIWDLEKTFDFPTILSKSTEIGYRYAKWRRAYFKGDTFSKAHILGIYLKCRDKQMMKYAGDTHHGSPWASQTQFFLRHGGQLPPKQGVFQSSQNKGHLGSGSMYIYICIHFFLKDRYILYP